MRYAFLKKRDRALIEFGPLFRQGDADDPPVSGISLSGGQFFFFQPVYDTGQVAHRDHHLFADLAEREASGVSEGCHDIELGQGEIQPLQVVLKPFIGCEIKAQKANPQTGRVACKEWSFVRRHDAPFKLKGYKIATTTLSEILALAGY